MRNKKNPACLAATGRGNGNNDTGIVHPPLKIRKCDYQARASSRAALRLLGQRIVFYGPTTYRLGRVSLGLRPDVSLFDLDTNTLMSLGRAMKEVLE